MPRKTDRAENRRLDDWEQDWKNSFKEPGDYWAGEPPTVDDVTIGYQPDGAPYPLRWPPEKRIEMTWWAQRENIKVDYDPNAADEGASGWEAAWASMERMVGMERGRIAAARAAAANPTGQLPASEPTYVDPGEPRHPRDDIGGVVNMADNTGIVSLLGMCALCMRQHFLDIESEAARPQEMRPAETIFQGTATCYMHLEDLYAATPITHNRKAHDGRPR